jgi:hypothetical protein
MENDDKFLEEFRRDPPAGFARRLRERLREQEEAPARRWQPLLAAAALIAVVAGLFAFPAVRAGAQSLLDLFRVRSFVAVSFDGTRMDKLKALDRDHAMMIFDHKDVLQEPGPPVVQSSLAAASGPAGFSVAAPAYLPAGLALDTVAVSREGRARLSVSASRLRDLLAALDLRDVEVPAGLDGQQIAVHTLPVVIQSYRSDRHHLSLVQARSPEISLPTGVDLPRLGEIGLRILGLDAGEARRIAASVDWRSTLLVPVPTNASSFRSVTVRGNPGLLITTTKPDGAGGDRRRAGTVVLWTEGDRVFALQGTLTPEDVMQVAESVR